MPALFEREIAPARTFVYYEEVESLIEKNLIKGGSLENAVVVRGDAVLSKEPLRFQDEFVRHKILDIVGDLALVGCRIRGHLIAVKPGHAANAELARAIAKEQSRRDALTLPRVVPKGDGGLDSEEIMQILPHRYPFLMVDRIVSFDESGTKCVGVKSVTINELPGDTMFIHAELTKARGERLAKAKCHCVVNDAIVSEGELMFTFLDR